MEVRYRDPTQMGKAYLLPAGSNRPVPGLTDEEPGPDADDPELTLEDWRSRIRRHPGELKNLLRNQSFVAGIGNAYSDEILHAARLLPFRKRSSLAPEEVDELHAATRKTIRLCSSTSARKETASACSTRTERIPPIGFVRRKPGRKVRSNSGEIASTDRLTRRLDGREQRGLGKGPVDQPRRSVPA